MSLLRPRDATASCAKVYKEVRTRAACQRSTTTAQNRKVKNIARRAPCWRERRLAARQSRMAERSRSTYRRLRRCARPGPCCSHDALELRRRRRRRLQRRCSPSRLGHHDMLMARSRRRRADGDLSDHPVRRRAWSRVDLPQRSIPPNNAKRIRCATRHLRDSLLRPELPVRLRRGDPGGRARELQAATLDWPLTADVAPLRESTTSLPTKPSDSCARASVRDRTVRAKSSARAMRVGE